MSKSDAEQRNKGKFKKRERKKHPYRLGGGKRSMNLGDSKSSDKNL